MSHLTKDSRDQLPIDQEIGLGAPENVARVDLSSILEEEVMVLRFAYCRSMVPEVPDDMMIQVATYRGVVFFNVTSPYIIRPLLRIPRDQLPTWCIFSRVQDGDGRETFVIK